MEYKELFIFGAGFTKAFVPEAPTLKDEWNITQLLLELEFQIKAKNTKYEIIYKIIKEYEEESYKYNIEAILTRLNTYIPNINEEEEEIIISYYNIIKKLYIDKIDKTTINYWPKDNKIREMILNNKYEEIKNTLGKFAMYCKSNSINCISLNCDTIFDEILFRTNEENITSLNHWQPDRGYGFFCKPIIPTQQLNLENCSMEYLKLHGSLNWRLYNGEKLENTSENIHHFENWFNVDVMKEHKISIDDIESQLDKDPFVVPPLLSKSDFMRLPILITLWKKASDLIAKAERITIIGYSFPETDYIIRSLLLENIKKNIKIVYVTNSHDKLNKRKKIKKLFEKYNIKPRFSWIGAEKWAKKYNKKAKVE